MRREETVEETNGKRLNDTNKNKETRRICDRRAFIACFTGEHSYSFCVSHPAQIRLSLPSARIAKNTQPAHTCTLAFRINLYFYLQILHVWRISRVIFGFHSQSNRIDSLSLSPCLPFAASRSLSFILQTYFIMPSTFVLSLQAFSSPIHHWLRYKCYTCCDRFHVWTKNQLECLLLFGFFSFLFVFLNSSERRKGRKK